jgi:hypothetical protein
MRLKKGTIRRLAAVMLAGWLAGSAAWAGNEDLERCGQCHEYAWRTFRQDLHGAAALAGDRAMPTCLTCHGSKAIAVPLNLKSSNPEQARANSFRRCSPCHPLLKSNPWLAQGKVAFHQDLSLLAPLEYSKFPFFWRYFPGKVAWAARAFFLLLFAGLFGLALIYLTALWSRLLRSPEAAVQLEEPFPSSMRRTALVVVTLALALTLTALPLLWPDLVLSAPIVVLFGSASVLRQVHQLLGLISALLLLGWFWKVRQEVVSLAAFRRMGRMILALLSPRTLWANASAPAPGEEDLFRVSAGDLFSLLIFPALLVALAGGWLWWDRASLALLPKWALDSLLVAHGIGGLLVFIWVVFIYGGLVLLRPWLLREARPARVAASVPEKSDAVE